MGECCSVVVEFSFVDSFVIADNEQCEHIIIMDHDGSWIENNNIIMDYGLWIMDYGSWIMDHGSWNHGWSMICTDMYHTGVK